MATPHFLRLAFLVTILALMFGCGQETSKQDEVTPISVAEAERLFRDFFNAIAESDEAQIRRLAIDAPGTDELWKGTLWGGDTTDKLLHTKRKILALGNFRQLNTGDRVKTSEGNEMTVPPGIITETRKMYALEMDLLSGELWMDLVWSDGQWKIDAEPILNAFRVRGSRDQTKQ